MDAGLAASSLSAYLPIIYVSTCPYVYLSMHLSVYAKTDAQPQQEAVMSDTDDGKGGCRGHGMCELHLHQLEQKHAALLN